MKTTSLSIFALIATTSFLHAAPLTQSTFTEVIRDVSVIAATTRQAQPAAVNSVFKLPDLVRTGLESRAELTAADKTITRVGANTVFSFESATRTMNLEKGSLLFHSPKGRGGGTIKSGGASAAVLGTTLIIAATDNGGFKVIVLEGKAFVTLPGGRSVTIPAGKMVYILPGSPTFGPVLDVNLDRLVGGSLLVNGFNTPLASLGDIRRAVEEQQRQIASGRLRDTGALADEIAFKGLPPAGLNGLDPVNLQNSINNYLLRQDVGSPGQP
jgi:hypothetical protein